MSSYRNISRYEDCINRLEGFVARGEAVLEASRSDGPTLPTSRLPDRETGDRLALQRLSGSRDRSPWSTRSRRRRSPINVPDRQRENALANARYWRYQHSQMSLERDTARDERDTAREQRDAAWERLHTVSESLQHVRDGIELLRGPLGPLEHTRRGANIGSADGVEGTPSWTRVSGSATVTPATSVNGGEEFPETG